MILSGATARSLDWTAESLPAYDQLFQQTNGWIGADGDFAVSLTNGLTLWLFSDTFVGAVRDGHRIPITMVHNTAAWQLGSKADDSHVEFFVRKSADGKPASLITPEDGTGWFWLFDAAMTHGKLFLFLAQIQNVDEKAVFGFQQIGTWIGVVSNPLAPPTQWKITQKKIPFARPGTNDSRYFGSAVLKTNGYVYIFGTREPRGADKRMILGRAPEPDLDDFAAWQFRTRDGWSTNADDAADLCGNVASDYSVSWLPGLKQYVLICTENGLSKKILARTANDPWGPWSPAMTVYRCPEPEWSRTIFCYAAKAHPMLSSAPDELIVTYAANSFDFAELLEDARIYWPRFVRIKIRPAAAR